MKLRKGSRLLNAASVTFCFLLAINFLGCSAQDTSRAVSKPPDTSDPHVSSAGPAVSKLPVVHGVEPMTATTASPQEPAQASEAARAYKQALSTLSNITTSSSQASNRLFGSDNTHSRSILSSLLPSPHGQGPVGSSIRILIKLYQQSWLPGILSSLRLGKDGLGGASKKEEEMRGKAIKVVDLLQHSAELGHLDALYTLAQISLFPPSIHFPLDPKLAYDSLFVHASQTGNPTSQSLLAFFYATGYHQVVPVDQAKAQLYYTFAAHGGDKGAQMALGYRHWAGISTLEDCGKALEWYESAAEQAMVKFLSGPPGGRTLPQTATRLSDLVGGVYGPGASVASTGYNKHRPAIKAGFARSAGETWEDVVEYFLFNAERGETEFAYRLGKIYYQGSIYSSQGGIASGSEGVGAVPRDLILAGKYFMKIAREAWPHDPPNPAQYEPSASKEENGPTDLAVMSAGYLGRMALRGEGVKADPAVAKMWFERGAAYSDKECHNGLGIIWRDGLVQGRVDMKKAMEHFTAASGQDLAEAQVNLGKSNYDRGDLKQAANLFESAIRHGSPFEAYYYMAAIQSAHARTPSIPPSMANGFCAMAVSFYKLVAERGVWEDDLLHDAEIAWLSGTDRGKELAILKWWIAAERGFETAQNNLAHVLDRDKSVLRLAKLSPFTPSNNTAQLALTQWTRSAGQTNVDALVKVGDYYYHGLGISEEDGANRMEKAARYYQSAADTQVSALAMWNLGWMYENGVGVPQDFHLAKRHYDLALETNAEAYFPVLLSLAKLYVRSIWHTLRGGTGGLSLWRTEEEGSVLSQHRNEELDGTSKEGGHETVRADDDPVAEEDDGPWYMGKAKEQFYRRRRGHGNVKTPDEEDDPIQWARDRRSAEQDRDNDFGPEDDFEGAMRGHRGEEEFDEFTETLLLLGLCLLVSVLFYVRIRVARAQQQRQQDEGANQPPARPNENEGLFPPPGDPARDEWAVLR